MYGALEKRASNPFGLLLACFLICFGVPQTATGAESVHRLTLYYTNDLEGRLLPSAFMGESSRGGFARLVSVLGRADKDALILDAGDALGEAALA
ncbi:MAG: 2',3'-cyclic-nucleotide 2'-phosphodiesterase (5'-nucleotidase family), partial [Candidatus Latescibacterota bacterium]